MKFLHTADVHLGKSLCEHALIEDQQYVLADLIRILADESYAALIIAGDVYDRVVPSTEAVDLFSGFLAELRLQRPDLDLFILSGNHDSASRLGFGKEIFSLAKIHLVTTPEDSTTPVIVTRDGERTAFFLLPFLNRGSFGQTRPIVEAARRLEYARQQVEGVTYTVLGTHLFANGGVASDSERHFVGTAELVDIALFAGFDYVALGHLHRYQKIAGNAFYSGSPLAYSFSEESDSHKVFLSVELTPDGPHVESIPIRPLRKLTRCEGLFRHFFDDSERDESLRAVKDDYLEIVLTDPTLQENAHALLQTRYPWILSIKQSQQALHTHERNAPDTTVPDTAAKSRTIVDDFNDFLVELYGQADDERVALFTDFLQEIEDEEFKL
jgi:exonuclease SbcD